ncbi:unnamed protein product [Haemonchus placei]|uniref:Secreted protein n=1 Tax=Haemonchus placei TaxID=6290 RepID=A0A0N4WIE5_HAEPC|nr:unnamed protein product [Haemonchus placei]
MAGFFSFYTANGQVDFLLFVSSAHAQLPPSPSDNLNLCLRLGTPERLDEAFCSLADADEVNLVPCFLIGQA